MAKTDAWKFARKSEQFLQTMRDCEALSRWDAAGLNAVHAVISAADSVLAYRGGMRSAEQDHAAVVRLLEETVGKALDPASRRHITAVVAKKNLVAYEQRQLTEQEALDMSSHAQRFCAWANRQLPTAS